LRSLDERGAPAPGLSSRPGGGVRLMARRDPVGIRLLTRNGHYWAPRYPLIVEAVNVLKVRSA